VLLLPDPASTLVPEAAQNLTETGLGNPITAVLIAYRSFDTMLEMVVLVLAVVGVWPLAPNRYWGAPLEHPRAGSAAGMHADFPRAIVAAAWNPRWRSHLLGRADEPGGAVEGGAILAAMWMITMKAKLTEAP
jgi:hypothetical protein